MRSARRSTPAVHGLLLALPLALLAALTLAALAPMTAEAQDVDRQQLAIERQLRCPQCVNERLDACQLKICEDMRGVIRERLEAGDHPDDIILYFTQRFGDRIRWELEPEGFNLVLFGWVGGSVLLVGGAGGWVLWRMRREAVPAGGPASTRADAASDEDRWLDEQLGPRASDRGDEEVR